MFLAYYEGHCRVIEETRAAPTISTKLTVMREHEGTIEMQRSSNSVAKIKNDPYRHSYDWERKVEWGYTVALASLCRLRHAEITARVPACSMDRARERGGGFAALAPKLDVNTTGTRRRRPTDEPLSFTVYTVNCSLFNSFTAAVPLPICEYR